MRIRGVWIVIVTTFVVLRVGVPEAAVAAVPPEWTCDAGFYGTDDGCDCGCGALDPDCDDASAESCDDCGDEGGCNAGNESCSAIDPTQNWLCKAAPPPAWTCDPSYYGSDDGCDCGCGVLDPDCKDATVASCEYCGEDGACDAGSADCSTINSTQNWLCLAAQAAAPAMSMSGLVLVALLLSAVGVLGLSRRGSWRSSRKVR